MSLNIITVLTPITVNRGENSNDGGGYRQMCVGCNGVTMRKAQIYIEKH